MRKEEAKLAVIYSHHALFILGNNVNPVKINAFQEVFMPLPLQITFKDIPATNSLTSHIQAKAEKLHKFSDKIISCHIVVEMPQKHQHNGKVYNIRIDMSVPHEEIIVNKVENENIFVAIRDAFNAAKRKLIECSHK